MLKLLQGAYVINITLKSFLLQRSAYTNNLSNQKSERFLMMTVY